MRSRAGNLVVMGVAAIAVGAAAFLILSRPEDAPLEIEANLREPDVDSTATSSLEEMRESSKSVGLENLPAANELITQPQEVAEDPEPRDQPVESEIASQADVGPWQDDIETEGEKWFLEQRRREQLLLTPSHRVDRFEKNKSLNPDGRVLSDEERGWLKDLVNRMQPRYEKAWQSESFRGADVIKKMSAEGRSVICPERENDSRDALSGPPPEFPGQIVGVIWPGGEERRIVRVNPGEDPELDRLTSEKISLGNGYFSQLKSFFEYPSPPPDGR